MPPDDLRRTAAADLVSLIPLYHTVVLKHGAGLSGFPAARFRILHILAMSGSSPISEIGRRVCISKPHMTAIIDSLTGEGLVTRRPDPADRRVIRIRITRKGQAHLKEAAAAMKDHIRDRLALLSDADILRLCSALDDLRAILLKIPEEP